MKTLTLGLDDDYLLLNDEAILHRYDAGDCEYVKNTPEHHSILYSSLYDAVNTGELPDRTNVYLPDGTLFGHSEGFHFIADMEFEEPEPEPTGYGYYY